MAMAFTAIAQDPVLVEEGTFGMNYKASGAIKAGMAVCCSGGTEVVRANAKNCQLGKKNGYVGVAATNAAHGDQVAVYGVGNKVRVRASGAITVGTHIVPVSKGFFQAAAAIPSGQTYGVCLEAITSNAYGKVLLTH